MPPVVWLLARDGPTSCAGQPGTHVPGSTVLMEPNDSGVPFCLSATIAVRLPTHDLSVLDKRTGTSPRPITCTQ